MAAERGRAATHGGRAMPSSSGPAAPGTKIAAQAKVARVTDSPVKSGAAPEMSSRRRGESSQRGIIAPVANPPAVSMRKDSGPKTAREREFNKAIGKSGGDQFQTTLEKGTLAEIARGDRFTGATKEPRKKQAQ